MGVAAALTLSITGASGHSPTSGSAGFGSDQNVTYKFAAAGYPSWMTTAANGTLTANWPSSSDNNSHTATFTYNASGTGTVFDSSATTSPCGTNDPAWIQCASGFGSTSFNIYIRNFSGAPLQNYTWYDISASCPAYNGTNSCFYARRALIHEVGHVAVSFAHSGESQSDTVMTAATPRNPLTGWNTVTIRGCDEARAQLLYDLRSSSGPYAGCYDHIAGAGTNGLYSKATASPTSYTVCLGSSATATGRLAIFNTSNYGPLADNPLTNRTIWFDRKPSTSSTWTLNITSAVATNAHPGNNWSRAFSTSSGTPITYNFRAHFDGETGVDPSVNQGYALFNITWKNPPC